MIALGMATKRDVAAGIDVGRLIEMAIRDAGLTPKEAIALMRTDAGTWSRAIRGLAPLDLWAMRHLPVRFWQWFLPSLASALIRQFWLDATVDLQMAKSDLKSETEHRRVSQ